MRQVLRMMLNVDLLLLTDSMTAMEAVVWAAQSRHGRTHDLTEVVDLIGGRLTSRKMYLPSCASGRIGRTGRKLKIMTEVSIAPTSGRTVPNPLVQDGQHPTLSFRMDSTQPSRSGRTS